jgi:RNA polymerase sigma-70 factor (ECF subfamily)
MHDIEGYRHEEIAELLGLAIGTSKSQLHRARMALRRHLEPDGSARGGREQEGE